MKHIGFNKPYVTGREGVYIQQAVLSGKISGDGIFTKKCHDFFEQKYGFKKVLLTTSCTDALEMAAMLLNILPGDEVIAPAFTFVSTVNAFVLRGAKIVFADSAPENPNVDVSFIETLITTKTKAIVVVHYAGVACNMDAILALGKKYNLVVVEDAAHAIDSCYKGKPLGSLGSLAAFSFHETKNISSGEGGMLVINDEKLIERAEIIREKGTNRSAFFRGEIKKYEWVDIGSSFLPSDIMAAFLFSQAEELENIQKKRKTIWNLYQEQLKALQSKGQLKLPFIPEYATNNAHMFYLLCKNPGERSQLIERLHQSGIQGVFHYLPLHKSPFYSSKHDGRELPMADYYAGCLLRLPMFFELTADDVSRIAEVVHSFYIDK